MWCKITGWISCSNNPLSAWIFVLQFSIEKQNQLESFKFTFYCVEEKQIHFVEFNDSGSDTKKLVANSVLESTKKSTKYVNV